MPKVHCVTLCGQFFVVYVVSILLKTFQVPIGVMQFVQSHIFHVECFNLYLSCLFGDVAYAINLQFNRILTKQGIVPCKFVVRAVIGSELQRKIRACLDTSVF